MHDSPEILGLHGTFDCFVFGVSLCLHSFCARTFCVCLVRSYACILSFACIFCVNLVHSYACISYLLAYFL